MCPCGKSEYLCICLFMLKSLALWSKDKKVTFWNGTYFINIWIFEDIFSWLCKPTRVSFEYSLWRHFWVFWRETVRVQYLRPYQFVLKKAKAYRQNKKYSAILNVSHIYGDFFIKPVYYYHVTYFSLWLVWNFDWFFTSSCLKIYISQWKVQFINLCTLYKFAETTFYRWIVTANVALYKLAFLFHFFFQ